MAINWPTTRIEPSELTNFTLNKRGDLEREGVAFYTTSKDPPPHLNLRFVEF